MSDMDTTIRGDEPRPGFGARLGVKALVVVLSPDQLGLAHVLDMSSVTIGRGKACEMQIQDPLVSSEHCRIAAREGGYAIEDVGSTNGTFVNGRRVEGTRSLHYGDRITIGKTILRFYIEERPDER